MKSSKWTLARKARKKYSNYPYYARHTPETDTPGNLAQCSSLSAVPTPVIGDKETVWSSDGEEAGESRNISSNNNVSDDSSVRHFESNSSSLLVLLGHLHQ